MILVIDKDVASPFFQKPPPPFFPSYFRGLSPNLPENLYLLCTISLGNSVAVKKTSKFPSILKNHEKIVTY